MANNEYTSELKFKSSGLKDIIKDLQTMTMISKGIGANNKVAMHELKAQARETAKAYKDTEKFWKAKNDLLEKEKENAKRIADLQKRFEYESKTGNKEEAKKLKNAIEHFKVLQKEYALRTKPLKDQQIEIKRQKELLDIQDELSQKQTRRLIDARDDFRHKGLMAGLKNFFPSKLVNAQFDDKIYANDKQIESTDKEIRSIDRELETNPNANKEELQARRRQLESERSAKTAENKKLAAEQMVFNTAMNGLKKLKDVSFTVFKTMGFDLKNIMSDVITNITQALNSGTGMATYDVGSSIFSNATARETRMKYGLSASSGYALTQVMDTLNMKSDEDLMYMNQTQKEIFNNLMDRYKGWYEQLESTGALIKLQQAQLEFKMFKQELSMKLLNWFAEHKDAIFKIMELIMWSLDKIATVVEWILDLIPGSSSATTSTLGNSDTYNSNTNSNININVNNTNNATANLNSKMELESTLTNANSNLVKQIGTALTSR